MFGAALGMAVISRIVTKGKTGTIRMIAAAFAFIQIVACANNGECLMGFRALC